MSAAARAELGALIARFAWQVDREHGAGVEELFTSDGVYEMDGAVLEGRASIAAFYGGRRARGRMSRHIFTNVHVLFVEGDRARTASVLTLHAADGRPPHPVEPLLVADYDDTFARGDDGMWRFARRVVTLVFGTAPSLHTNGAG